VTAIVALATVLGGEPIVWSGLVLVCKLAVLKRFSGGKGVDLGNVVRHSYCRYFAVGWLVCISFALQCWFWMHGEGIDEQDLYVVYTLEVARVRET